ncbi:hypothetical protein QA640_23690 [Bradyrhizobium sp. CB82]|uniref:hypothetical protein n=1 Tax=Bradyrhizobium sp. CB82 TaxID=3039159 RepID=UPI0024B18026|nr:hypothetical protein [Bradyrhizobium sp. CB82]WFU37484.1 hypothetical protein QA640_23690 [Bradyrhizobium sp. CB82]
MAAASTAMVIAGTFVSIFRGQIRIPPRLDDVVNVDAREPLRRQQSARDHRGGCEAAPEDRH